MPHRQKGINHLIQAYQFIISADLSSSLSSPSSTVLQPSMHPCILVANKPFEAEAGLNVI
jgi:hypothetical protein